MKKMFLLLLIMFAFITTVSAYKFNVDYWVLLARGGVGYPILESGNHLNLGFSGGLSVRKGFDTELSAGGGVSYVNMPYKKAGLGMWMVKYANLSSAETSQLSDQTTFGFQFGIGASYPINNLFAANAEVMFNQASISGGTGDLYNFLTFCAGVTMLLK